MGERMSVRPLTILVDVDNVLEDLNTAWVNAVNQKYGTSTKPEDIVSWRIEKYFEGLSRTQVFSPLHDPKFWESLTPLDGAQEYMQRLIKDGHKLFVVTSCHPDTIKFKHKFLAKYFPFIPFKDVIITSHKQMIKGDVLIDDAPHNFDCSDSAGNQIGLLMGAPHNRDFNALGFGLIRVESWKEIYEAINRIQN